MTMKILGKLGSVPQFAFPEPDAPDDVDEDIPDQFIDEDGEVDEDALKEYEEKLKEETEADRYESRTEI